LPAASVSSFGVPVDAGMPPRADQDEDIPKSRVREGRWTEKEHALFLEGYKVYGKSWKDLSRYIGSRTPEQIRTHAQKYFAKHEKPRRSSFDSTKRVKLDSYDAQSSLPSLNPLPTHQDLRLARSPVFRSQSGNLLGGGGSRPRSSSFDVSYQRPRAESVCSTADSESTGPFHNHALSILIRELEEQHNSTVKEEDDDDDDDEYDDDYSFDDSGDGSSSGRRRKRASAVGWKNRYSGTEWAKAAEERGDDEDEGFDDVEDDDSMDEKIIVGFSSRPMVDEQDDESIEETFGRRSGPAGSGYGRRPPTGRRSEDMEDDDDEEYRLGEDEGAPRKRSGSSAGSKAGGAVRIREGRWSREEHALFLRAYKRYGKAWKEISRIVVTRTPEQIRTHAQKYFQKQNRHRTAGGAAGSARGGAGKASGDDNMSVDADEDEAQQEDAEGMMPGSTKSFSRASRPRRSSVSSVGSITDSVPSSTNNATRGKASSAPSTSRSASSSPLTQPLSVTTSAATSPDRLGITTSEGTPSSPDANSSRVGGTTEESDMDDDDEEEEPISSDDEPARGRRRKSKEGRWTKEEHSSFLEGLKLYGKSWRDIQTLVKTRTPDQIRTHAQKYFIKLGKYDGDSTTPPLTSVSPLPSDMGAAVAQRPTALEVMEAGKVMAS
jgi:SHAQKYF class myb-like DNA-binding protein